jgi:hypothetical protein
MAGIRHLFLDDRQDVAGRILEPRLLVVAGIGDASFVGLERALVVLLELDTGSFQFVHRGFDVVDRKFKIVCPAGL